jgi:hypothetical protein
MSRTTKEIEKRYNAMLDNYPEPVKDNKVNCYVCPCSQITKTIDVHPGVTPAMMICENCGNMARSTWYKDIAPHQGITQKYYRPSLKAVLKMHRRGFPEVVEHILLGGLLARARKVTQAEMKELELLASINKS